MEFPEGVVRLLIHPLKRQWLAVFVGIVRCLRRSNSLGSRGIDDFVPFPDISKISGFLSDAND